MRMLLLRKFFNFSNKQFQGNSVLTRQMLLQHESVFQQPISKIYYCYTNFQDSFKEIQNKLGNKVVFVQGFSGQSFFTEQGISNRSEESKAIIIVLDDCMSWKPFSEL